MTNDDKPSLDKIHQPFGEYIERLSLEGLI